MKTMLYISFGLCTFLAGFFDFLFYRIPNLFILFILALFLGTFILPSKNSATFMPLMVATVTFTVCYLFYLFKWLGAGDVKFISATALWASFMNASVFPFFLYVSLIGGGVAFLYMIFGPSIDSLRLWVIRGLSLFLKHNSFFKKYAQNPFIYTTTSCAKEIKIPYGIAITVGSLFITCLAIWGD